MDKKEFLGEIAVLTNSKSRKEKAIGKCLLAIYEAITDGN